MCRDLPHLMLVKPHARESWGRWACSVYVGPEHPRAYLHASGYGETPREAYDALMAALADARNKRRGP